MILAACQHDEAHKHGKDRKGNIRYKCVLCGKTFVKETVKPIGEMRIDVDRAASAIAMMLEGLSIRSIQRLTGLGRKTLCDLILVVGQNCQRLLDSKVRNVPVNDVQLDEIWGFVHCKEKTRVKKNYSTEVGDSWTFLAIERDTKLILAHQVGGRDSETCCELLHKLNAATSGRFQLTTDGLRAYTNNVPFVLGTRVDFAQLIKVYSHEQSETRYSPATIISAEKIPVFGNPDFKSISTSHIERFNLTLRMTMRRFTRLTNGHSKSQKHHRAAQAIFVAAYNFARKHETLKGNSPAMASGLANHVWSVKELLENAATCD
jgi:transposase-like protein/IS1 family transposase